MRRLIKRFRDWLDSLLDMHLSFDGDLMTPDWTPDEGDPHYRTQPATIRSKRTQ